MIRPIASSLLALCAVVSCAGRARAAEEPFDPSRDPAADLRVAVAQARRENKRILLDVGGEWCVWCHALDRTFAREKPIANLLATGYVVVKVNFSPENENTALLKAFPTISGYPHLFVLDEDGKLLHSQATGPLEAPKGKGYDLEKLAGFLRRWAPYELSTPARLSTPNCLIALLKHEELHVPCKLEISPEADFLAGGILLHTFHWGAVFL